MTTIAALEENGRPAPVIMKVANHLVKLASEGFYGRVIVVFEAGNIRVVKQERTLKPDDLG